jgi:thiol:disulfide interchange protein
MPPFKWITAIAVSMLVSASTLTAGMKVPERLFQPVSLDQALIMAVKEKRIVFIDFCTTWCGACKKLDEDTWSNAKVIERLKAKTIPLKLDADENKLIVEKYKIAAYPTLLFLNPDGSILARVVGYQIPTQFIETLQGVLAEKRTRGKNQKGVNGER